MKIAQIVLPDASFFERKCQRVDAANLARDHEVLELDGDDWPRLARSADVVHVYGRPEGARGQLRRLTVPYVASDVPRRHWAGWRNAPEPARRVDTYATGGVPEAVEAAYFESAMRTSNGRHRIGALARGGDTVQMYHATVTRLARFRDDIDWELLETVPDPERLSGFKAWVDPCMEERDLSGYTAEALVAGLPVIASGTPANAQRLNGGAAGFLVPRGDPNELTHAIVTALFKSEQRERRLEHARATRDRFRPRHRVERLLQIYAEVAR